MSALSFLSESLSELKNIKAFDFVLKMPDGLDSVIGEDTGGLSEGQAQRIAVARAVLKGSPVLLLDEATAALDMETEKQLARNLLSLKKKRPLLSLPTEKHCFRFVMSFMRSEIITTGNNQQLTG